MEQMVWLLWSFKEAAYKAHQRLFGHPPILNWLRQKCKLTSITKSSASGEVNINGETYFTSSVITSEYIHSSATKDKKVPLKNVLFEGPSEAAKIQLLKQISDHYSVRYQQLSFQNDQLGIPYIQYKNKIFFKDFSFSGHGRYSGFSVSLRIS